MAEPAETGPEGWQVPQRLPMIAAAAVPLALLALLGFAGHVYDARLAPLQRQSVTAFPAPGIETFIHDGGLHPERPKPRPAPDPAVESAKRAVAGEGLPGWPAR